MIEPTFIVMRMADGYAAISNSHGQYHGRSLVGFGAYIRNEMRVKFGIASEDVAFTRGEQLTESVVPCGTCSGATRVETNGVAGQSLGDHFGTIDWSLRSTRLCPRCAGLGCEIPGFWEAAAQTA